MGVKLWNLTATNRPWKPSENIDDEFASGPEVTVAIACNDKYPSAGDYAEVREHYEHLFTYSEWGSVWEGVHLMCSGWPQIDQPRFQGPIGASNTSYPLLVIGNRHGM